MIAFMVLPAIFAALLLVILAVMCSGYENPYG